MTTLSAPAALVGTPCATCGRPLVSERGAAPWCAGCGWNIEFYDAERRRADLRWKWADKFSFHSAYEQNAAQFVELSGRPVDRPGFSVARLMLILVSLACLAFDLGLIALGVWLFAAQGNVPLDIVGALAIMVGLLLLPPIRRLGKYADPRDLDDYPTLHALVQRVATAIGAPVPRVLLLSERFNAGTGTYGLGRRFLSIGLPLWLSLTPQEQVALLGHELGHFVNGDVRRGRLTRYAFTFFERLDYLTRPDKGASRYGWARASVRGSYGVGAHGSGFADAISRIVFGVVNFAVAMGMLIVEWVGSRSSHRAEYAADAAAARVAGSTAAVSLIDTLATGEVCMTLLRRSARSTDISEWRSAIAEGRRDMAERLLRLRQLSMRESASLFVTHPPSGLRAQLVESRAEQPATVTLTELEAQSIDHEFARAYAELRTSLRA